MERLDIHETILEALALIGSEVRAKEVALETKLDYDLPRNLGDRVQLQQEIINLTVNGIEAIDRTDSRRSLVVSSAKEESADGVVVSVSDSGAGLDSAKPQHLFEAFYSTKSQGMDMGLSISRSIVEAHRGRIRATRNSLRGATFEFTLPAGSEKRQSAAQ
jgi:C4-dicarboxylate-specific signal transduction histidine kinase